MSEEKVYALEVKELSVKFPNRGGVFGKVKNYFTAVDNVSFSLEPGKILSIVGESGCGKSTLVKALVGLNPVEHGEIKIFGSNVSNGKFLEGSSTRHVSDVMQMIFQDPFSSLNPRMTISEILTTPLTARGATFAKAEKQAIDLLDRVSLPKGALEKFPHEFSGGQRQRLCIARSLMVQPKILLCDEVTSALDVSVQAQILHLLNDLRHDLGLSILFISHDMQVVRALSDDILVMYFGQVVERGSAKEVLANPKNDYTKKLLKSVPTIQRDFK